LLVVTLTTATAFGAAGKDDIRWVDFRQAQAQSKQTGKTMVIYFYSENCPSCTEMEKTTWKDTRVIDALNTRYTAVKVNVNKQRQIASLYKVYYLPTTWFIKPDGQPFGNRSGYIPADLLLKIFKHLPQ
jgi:thioredoxin-related protein